VIAASMLGWLIAKALVWIFDLLWEKSWEFGFR